MNMKDIENGKLERPLDDDFNEDPDLEDIRKAVRYITKLGHRDDLSMDELAMCHHIRFVLQIYEEEKEA